MTGNSNDRRKYGLIGHPLKHSLSPYIHDHIMRKCGIKGSYKLLDIPTDEFDDHVLKVTECLDGYNITIPYKERIIPYLNKLEGHAGKYSTVNTVIEAKGFSSDIEALLQSEIPYKGNNILILGAGGAARAVLAAALISGCRSAGVWSRRTEQSAGLIEEFRRLHPNAIIFQEDTINTDTKSTNLYSCDKAFYDVIVNATPAGMWPECGIPPVSRELILNSVYVYDTIYNPLATRLVLCARSYGIRAESGLDMLVRQAVVSQKIWDPKADLSLFSPLKLQQRVKYMMFNLFPIKIVLTGFMGCGKTVTGKALASVLKIPFTDLDEVIIERTGMTITDFFAENGEETFRDIESENLKEVMRKEGSIVIATGGGTLMRDQNVETVRSNRGFIFFLDAEPEISIKRTENDTLRPLLKNRTSEEIRELYSQRLPAYIRASDHIIDSSGSVTDSVNRIKAALGLSDALHT